MAGPTAVTPIDLWSTVRPLLDAGSYLVLATADADGRPWVTPLFFAMLDDDHLVWVSSPDSRHSANLEVRPDVAATVFDSHAPIGRAEAVYVDAVASLVPEERLPAACERMNDRLPPHQHLTPDDLVAGGALRAYAARISELSVLVRGGDPRFTNEVDTRLVVTRPEPEDVCP